ncbi:type II toxin-antitoxin system HicB family antitoxin [Oleidesulfovibrio sp.]|uniref:type II toxin-antitoxin system HicB family antitoxin n=1 Tax=Oleidesulfovibrio sp. TaxID=2909707 RepID=UPI003A85B1DC
MIYYFAVFTPVTEGGYVVTFPDFPEALSQGESFEECLINAEDVLSIVIEEYTAARRALPKASTLEETQRYAESLKEELDGAADSFFQLVQSPSTDTTPVRINISLPKYVLEHLDRKARALGMNRSKYIAHSALHGS